ncbi:hypothetical protein ACQKQC_19130 [Vibrio fortis]|uniref:hypothetical protein n=1 Tax=Vibrio fortis TaxID=212667 RepID=UPI0040694EA0
MEYELKSVTSITSFSAVRVFVSANEKHALLDQDGHLVGLIERDCPYYPHGSFSDACIAAKRSLKMGATYKAYPCTPFGQFHYTLDKKLEPVTSFSDIPEVKSCEEIYNDALALLNRIKSNQKTSSQLLPNEKLVN